MIIFKTFTSLLRKTNLGMALCRHNFLRIGGDFEVAYDAFYFVKFAEFRCSKCKKKSHRTTSRFYIKLPRK